MPRVSVSDLHAALHGLLTGTARTSRERVRLSDFGPPGRRAPQVLGHYTSTSGARGILESKRIWLTNSDFLNDSAEQAYLWELIERHDRPLAKRVLDWYRKGRGSKSHTYVASFSSSYDQLSQWRAYGTSTVPYALLFSGSQLDEIARAAGIELLEVVYDPAHQMQILTDCFDAAAEMEKNEEFDYQGIDFALALMMQLDVVGACFKHPSWREEGEWRLTCVPTSESRQPWLSGDLKFRESASYGLIPFQELIIPAGVFQSLIVGVVQGPSPYPEVSRRGMSTFLLAAAELPVTSVQLTDTRLR